MPALFLRIVPLGPLQIHFGFTFLLASMSFSPSFKVQTILQNPAQFSGFHEPSQVPSWLYSTSHLLPHGLALHRGLFLHFPKPEAWGPFVLGGWEPVEGCSQASLAASSAGLTRAAGRDMSTPGCSASVATDGSDPGKPRPFPFTSMFSFPESKAAFLCLGVLGRLVFGNFSDWG